MTGFVSVNHVREMARTRNELQSLLPGNASIESFHNPRPVVSNLPFAYEPLDHPALQELYEREIAEAVGDATDELDIVFRICAWAAGRFPQGSPRHWHKPESALDILSIIDSGGADHCDARALCFIQACLSVGTIARYVEDTCYFKPTFPDSSHGLAEVWINDLDQWVLFDPTANYYIEDKHGRMLSALEKHNTHFDSGRIEEDEIDYDLMKPTPVPYGESASTVDLKAQKNFPYFNICMRNDFISKNLAPYEPNYYINRHRTHVCWLDKRIGPRPLFYNHCGVEDDLYWDVNWTWMAFEKAGEDAIRVYFEAAVPSFSHLDVEVNGEPRRIDKHAYPFASVEWPIRKGGNALRAQAFNVKGRGGRSVEAAFEI